MVPLQFERLLSLVSINVAQLALPNRGDPVDKMPVQDTTLSSGQTVWFRVKDLGFRVSGLGFGFGV